jgi:hypothetical protein
MLSDSEREGAIQIAMEGAWKVTRQPPEPARQTLLSSAVIWKTLSAFRGIFPGHGSDLPPLQDEMAPGAGPRSTTYGKISASFSASPLRSLSERIAVSRSIGHGMARSGSFHRMVRSPAGE